MDDAGRRMEALNPFLSVMNFKKVSAKSGDFFIRSGLWGCKKQYQAYYRANRYKPIPGKN